MSSCLLTAARIGGGFDRAEDLLERLRQPPGEAAQAVVSPTPESPPPSRWSLAGIRATFDWLADYSLSGVWRVLRRHGLRLRSAQVQQFSPDPAYLEKLRHLLDCLAEAALHPDQVVVVFLDELGFTRWPEPTAVWSPAAPHPAPMASRSAANNTQWRLIGSLNALTGRVDFLDAYIVGRDKVSAFYHQVAAAYPQATRIYVVQDNWSIHTHEDVLTTVAALPRIEPVWLPTYAPWLNPIEKLWKWLRRYLLDMHPLADNWAELKAQVRAFLGQFASGSQDLLRYVGLLGDGQLATALKGG